MKKIVQATQMFALIALFPMIVILDLNRVTPASNEADLPLNVIEKTKNGSTCLPEATEEKMATGLFSISWKPSI